MQGVSVVISKRNQTCGTTSNTQGGRTANFTKTIPRRGFAKLTKPLDTFTDFNCSTRLITKGRSVLYLEDVTVVTLICEDWMERRCPHRQTSRNCVYSNEQRFCFAKGGKKRIPPLPEVSGLLRCYL